MATEGEFKDLKDQIAGVAEGVAKNGNAIEGLAGRIEGLDSRIEGLDGRIDGLDSRVQTLTTDVNGLDSRVQTLTTDVNGLDGRVQRLTTEVNDLRTQQSRAFADVLVVLQDVRDHTQGIPSLNERLQRTRDAIDFLGRKALKPEDYEQLKAIAGL